MAGSVPSLLPHPCPPQAFAHPLLISLLLTGSSSSSEEYSWAWFRKAVGNSAQCLADSGFLGFPSQHYLISVLARTEELGPESHHYCRLCYGLQARLLRDAFTSSEQAEVTFEQKEGFRRVGAYGVVFPMQVEDSVTLKLDLDGDGRVVFRDL